MRILIVDDEPLVARTLGLIFMQQGFSVEICSTGESALAAFRLQPPDLVLCDIEMPGRGGLALMADLALEKPSVPILVLTGAYGLLASVRDCARKLPQSVSVVTKPCQPAVLLRTAGDMLKIA